MEVPAEEQRREEAEQRQVAKVAVEALLMYAMQEEKRRREEEERRAAEEEEQRREEEEQRRAAQEETRRHEEEERRAAEKEEQRREEQEERRRAAEAAIERVLACGASDHCAVLAVSREAEMDALKEAYRHLSLLSHPDKCSHPRAKEAFVRIKTSFEVLSADIERHGSLDNAAAERAGLACRLQQDSVIAPQPPAARRTGARVWKSSWRIELEELENSSNSLHQFIAAAEKAAEKAATEKAAAEQAAAERLERELNRLNTRQQQMLAEQLAEHFVEQHLDNIFGQAFQRFEDRMDRFESRFFDDFPSW
jgi:curved DNA-binding protein CbpA